MVEAALLDLTHEFCTEARGAGSFVDDDASPGLLDAGFDRIDVERDQTAQIDDLGVYAIGLCRCNRDVDHGAVAQDGDLFAFSHGFGLTEGNRIMFLGNFTLRMGCPFGHRCGMVAIEGAVVQALGLEEDDRVIAFDRGDQQTLRIVGIGADDDFESGCVREVGFWGLAVVMPTLDAASARCSDGDGS